jgi:DNA-binding MarR family transcriptional regulator
MSASQQLCERRLDLAWSLWTGLGVPGQIDRHTDHAIDPESLIIFTAALGDEDPRLRDEAIDWCIRYGSLISGARLKNLVSGESQIVQERYGEFAATVAAHTSLRWPGQTKARQYAPRKRPPIYTFNRKSQMVLRLRGLLGTGARAEIIRAFLVSPDTTFSAADLAAETHFTKRNVAQILDALRLAGMIQAMPHRNQFHYRLSEEQAGQVRKLLAPIPSVFIRWPYALHVVTASVQAMKQFESSSHVVRAVEIRSLVDKLNTLIYNAHLEGPEGGVHGPEFWDEFVSWLLNTVETLAAGNVC